MSVPSSSQHHKSGEVMSVPSFGLLLLLTPIIAVVGDEFCNCEYTVPEPFEPNCRVFGAIGGEDSPVPWELASEKCVVQLGLSVSSMPRDVLWKICPFSNSSNVEVQLLHNLLESGTFSGVETVRAALPKFFRPEDDGTYVLRDSFLDTRNSIVNCTVSTRLCWSVIKDHFTASSNAREVACRSLHNYQREAKAEEQLLARSALCNPRDSVPATCTDLQQQINSLRDSTASCEAFGAPPLVEPLQCNWLHPPQLSASRPHYFAMGSSVVLLLSHLVL